MRNEKRIWFSFLSLDCLGVERYLNEYAESGWTLSDLQDCQTVTVPIQATSRRDLRYFVMPKSFGRERGNLLETIERMEELGWQPVATVNRLDIYASMPCRDCAPPPRTWSLSLYVCSFCGLLLLTALSFLLCLFASAQGVPLLHSWYLSNSGVLLRFCGPVFILIWLYYMGWLLFRLVCRGREGPSGRSMMYFRGLFPLLGAVWLFLLTAAIMSDLVHNLPWCLALILLLAGGAAFVYSRFRIGTVDALFSGLSLVLAACLVFVLALHQVFPGENRAQLGACSWRMSLSSVVHGEELGLDGDSVDAVSYEKTGSVFVTRTDYWEARKDVSLSSTVYQCRGSWFCARVQSDLLRDTDWEEVKGMEAPCWSRDSETRHSVLLRRGNTMVLLSGNRELLPQVKEGQWNIS